MSDRSSSEQSRPLPPKLRRLMDPKVRILSQRVAQDLRAADVRTLKQFVAEGRARPGDASLSRAIGALAVRDPSVETATLLAAFANDEREAPVDRAVAAASLRLIAVPEAREGLVTLLGAPEPIVRVEAVKALGCIGDEAALRALEGTQEGGEGRQLAFAKALIAHRVGQESEHLPFRAGVARRAGPPDQLIDLSLRPVRPQTIVGELGRLTGSDYSIPLSERVGFALTRRTGPVDRLRQRRGD